MVFRNSDLTVFSLRKSHENLAGAALDETSPSSVMSRSRSFGNLRLSAATPLNSQRSEFSTLGSGGEGSSGARDLVGSEKKRYCF